MELKTKDDRLQLTNGVYHSLVHARAPTGIENKSAYLIGTGIGALAAGCFLIRDAHMDGSKITFLEKDDVPGGSLDARLVKDNMFVARGGREIGHHFECLWDLFSSIPSYDRPDMTILDRFYYLNVDDPNKSMCRITANCGERYDNGKFNLTEAQVREIIRLLNTPDKDLEYVTIEDFFSEGLLETDFWTLWRSMFAFENWDSALEMKLYMYRFLHHVDGLPDLSVLQFTGYNQYESFVIPMRRYLEDHGATFKYGITVDNVEFLVNQQKKVARRIVAHNADGSDASVDVTEDDLVFITNGSMTECSTMGTEDEPAEFNKTPSGCWTMWRNIAAQCDEFGHPDVFCSDPEKTNWLSCSITTHTPDVPAYIEKITKRNCFTRRDISGLVSSGPVTVRDSSWMMSWAVGRQPQYDGQPENDVVCWVYGLFSDRPGDYIKKPMRDCSGKEICAEWLYHMGVPTDKIDELVGTCTSIPVMMPYITSQFMPRGEGDRPLVVPRKAVNFAFLGQFAETLDDPGRDTVFTIEYSGRTAMEAVYVLTGVEKGVPEVYASRYDYRYLMNGIHGLLDGRKPTLSTPLGNTGLLARKVEHTVAGQALQEYGLI